MLINIVSWVKKINFLFVKGKLQNVKCKIENILILQFEICTLHFTMKRSDKVALYL